MNKWRAIIALVVAFVLGIGAGGLIEHQRAKNDSNKKSTTAPTTAKGTAAGARWFRAPATAACPDIKKWVTAGGTAYGELLKKDAWPTTQTTLEAQSAAATAALKALLPHANKVGRKGLNLLLGREAKNLAAIKAAKDATAYATATKALTTPPIRKGNLAMGKANAVCKGGTTTTTAKTT